MIDYEKQKEIVSSSFDALVRYVSRQEFENYYLQLNEDDRVLQSTYELKSIFLCNYQQKTGKTKEETEQLYKLAERFVKNQYAKVCRARKYIADLLKAGPCVFATLTFTNECLQNTKQETRRKLVERYLKSQADCYIANLDFGSQFEREHYHAIIRSARINPTEWKYGALNVKKITIKNEKALAKYINKLSNHSFKNTTSKLERLIYSKERPTRKEIQEYEESTNREIDLFETRPTSS